MNKTYLIEIMQKSTIQFTFLSIIFAGLMLTFLIPSSIGAADARITATAASFVGPFSDVEVKMDKGQLAQYPIITGNSVHWVTRGSSILGGDELGTLEASVGNLGKVKFHFSNPTSGPNTCSTESPSQSLFVGCYISQGTFADASFIVGLPVPPQNTDNKFCDILTKYGGLEQTKVIREKLRC